MRDDATYELRSVVADIAYESGLDAGDLRTIICRALRVRSDPDNWSTPNIDREARGTLDSCSWNEVYDLIEEIRKAVAQRDARRPPKEAQAKHFDLKLNTYFVRRGIGWQLKRGLLEVRGAEGFEHAVSAADSTLEASGRTTARTELHEAFRDLARRPLPDLTGAIQHSLAALECIARDVTGDPKATLGSIMSKNRDIVPPPLNTAVEKLWGFASERGRHLREGGEPAQDEVELAVHVAAAVVTYLGGKLPRRGALDLDHPPWRSVAQKDPPF